MVATCAVGSMLYVLPMLLGRTYDMLHDKVGIDIYERKTVDEAKVRPLPDVRSNYMIIDNSNEKRGFLGISGELGVKIGAGLLDIRGAGDYLRYTSNVERSVEVLVKLTCTTVIREIDPTVKPMTFWQSLDKRSVGTHVVTSITYGFEVYASIHIVALKSEYLEEIKAKVRDHIHKSGTFDLDAQGKLEKLKQNISSQAKIEIDYYATVPLEVVPTTIEGLRQLVNSFMDHVAKVIRGEGIGVALCAGLRPLSDFDKKFDFLKDKDLIASLEHFSFLYNNLREAKSLLRTLVTSLPEGVKEDFLKKVGEFSGRLKKTTLVFDEVIDKMNPEKGSEQLTSAVTAFDMNSNVSGFSKYTEEVKQLMEENDSKEDPNKPRAVYVRWGKRSCGPKATNPLYIGFMSSFIEKGPGSGSNYLCLPENPDLNTDADAAGFNNRRSTLGAARYKSFSMFQGEGKKIEGKVASCTVCETPMRPTVRTYHAMLSCPGDWVQEYKGFTVSTNGTKHRTDAICVDIDPDTYEGSSVGATEPVVIPVSYKKEGEKEAKSVPCVVCSI